MGVTIPPAACLRNTARTLIWTRIFCLDWVSLGKALHLLPGMSEHNNPLGYCMLLCNMWPSHAHENSRYRTCLDHLQRKYTRKVWYYVCDALNPSELALVSGALGTVGEIGRSKY